MVSIGITLPSFALSPNTLEYNFGQNAHLSAIADNSSHFIGNYIPRRTFEAACGAGIATICTATLAVIHSKTVPLGDAVCTLYIRLTVWVINDRFCDWRTPPHIIEQPGRHPTCWKSSINSWTASCIPSCTAWTLAYQALQPARHCTHQSLANLMRCSGNYSRDILLCLLRRNSSIQPMAVLRTGWTKYGTRNEDISNTRSLDFLRDVCTNLLKCTS